MTDSQERKAAAILVAAAFLLFCLYSAATPLFEASDELWHYPFIQHLVAGGGLPIQKSGQTDAEAPWRQEGSQPPLYYAVAALVSAPFDHSNWRELRRINPHADMGVPTRDGNANAILHTPAENWPWARAALAIRVARLVSILMSTATVWFAYWAAREVFREAGDMSLETASNPPSPASNPQSLLRLATIIFTACVPMFAFISGAINNDNAAVMFSTLGLWWALRWLRAGAVSVRTASAAAVIAGAIAGLGALSKSSAVGLLGLFGVAVLLRTNAKWQGLNTAQSLRAWLSFIVPRAAICMFTMLLSFLLIAGWWFVRNLVLYGDVLGWNAFLDVVGRRDTPASLAQLWSEREGFVWAYWGVFGTLNIIMPQWVYAVLNGVVILALIGIVWGAVRRQKAETASCILHPSACSLLTVWIVLIFVSLLRWTALTPASQGRLLFPCIAAIAMFMAYGLWRIHRFVLLAACVFLIGLAAAVPIAVIAPAYARPPNTWPQRLPEKVQVTFGNALELVEYAGPIHPTAQPGDEVTLTLNWRLRAPLPKNYSVFVHLVDENNVIVAQRDMYPGQGNLALSELAPEYVWADHYTLRIAPLQYAPRTLHWRVGVYDHASGERLVTNSGADAIDFGALKLRTASSTAALLRFNNGVVLQGYAIQPNALTAGQPLTVTLAWLPAQPAQIDGDYVLSVQVLDDNANKIGSVDGPLTLSASDVRVIPINPDAQAAVYRLLLVIYRPNDFSRLGAFDRRGQFIGDQIELTRLRLQLK
jgi:4-amino-4-deoxy-L-arabinose transferase-like glycosyltransferase